MPPVFRYLSVEEQVELAKAALRSALTSFRSWSATLRARKLLESVLPVYELTPLDYTQFVRTLEEMCGSVVVDEAGRPWRVLHLRRDSHNRTVVVLRRLDGVEVVQRGRGNHS